MTPYDLEKRYVQVFVFCFIDFISFLALLNLFSRKRAWLPILSESFDFIPLINSKTGFFLRVYCLNLCGTETWCRNYL